MGLTCVRFALLAAVLSAQGLQVAHEGRWPAEATAQLDPSAQNDSGGREAAVSAHGRAWASAEDLATEWTSLMMHFILLKGNDTNSGTSAQQWPSGDTMRSSVNTSQVSDRASPTAASMASAQSSLMQAVGIKPVGLLEELRALEKRSAHSAGLVAELAARSANRTGSFVEQVAAQSAFLVAEMRELELQSARKDGPSHAFPHMHVVGCRSAVCGNHASPVAAAVAPPPGAGQEASGMLPAGARDRNSGFGLTAGQAPVGTVRVVLTLAGLCLMVVTGFFTASRKSLSVAEKQPMMYSRYSSRALPLRAVREHKHNMLSCPQDSEALSVWDGTVATFSCIVGTGLLAMPYAFSIAGMVAVPVTIFFVCCSAYTAHLMAWALNDGALEAERRVVRPAMRGWGLLVEAAYGRRAKGAMNAFLIVELWGYLLSSIVCTSMNVSQLAEDLSASTAIGISVTVAYGLTFVPARLLTRVNVVSNMVFMACCFMFIVTGLLLPAKAPASDVKLVKPHGLISAAGILVFSPAGHSFYPALMQRMQEPAKFPTCVRRAYAAACVLYLAVAVPGYCLFGNATQPSAVRNIGADLHLVPLPDLGWMNTAAAVGMVVKMLPLQTLVLSPLASTVEGVLGGHGLPEAVLGHVVMPGILVVSSAVAVHFAQEMAVLLNFIGSIFCMNIAFVVPVLCYWKLSREPVGCLRQLTFVVLVVMGSTFAVLGVATSL